MPWSIIFSATLIAISTPPPKPNAIVRMEAYRDGMQACRVEWLLENTDPSKPTCGREWYYTSRFANGDHLLVNRGDRNGVMFPDKVGEDLACSYDALLIQNGEQLQYTEDTCNASLYTNPSSFRAMYDVRTLGMVSISRPNLTPTHYTPEQPQSYAERSEGSLHEVTAQLSHGVQFTWTIDESKNFAPVRCVLLQDGAILSESRSEYEKFGEKWFPRQVTFYEKGAPTKTISVLNAVFDDPDEPSVLSPNDMGLFPGVNIAREDEQIPRMWTGIEAVSGEEYYRRVKAGAVDNSQYKAFQKRMKNGEGQARYPKQFDAHSLGLTEVERKPGLWEEYVRRFIQRYRLDKEQTRNAWRHHKKYQSQAYRYLASKRAELDKIDREIRQLSALTDEKSVKERTRAEERRTARLGPVQRIFDQSLKPRLEALLSREQKALAAMQPASKKDIAKP